MNQILISHESPLCLLEDSCDYNDYAYALVHLFERYPQYLSFFKQQLAKGGEVLLDNSIFELKKAFDADKFAKAIEDLEPTFYIVPDALEDSNKTVLQFNDWKTTYGSLPGLKIGVVQGKTYRELTECYKFMSDNADYIAISFDYSYYTLISDKFRKLEQWADGRKRLIADLLNDGIWDWSKPHHLLGASLVREFSWYRENNITNIRSIDTSAPVIAGISGMKYIRGIGNYTKPSILLADNLETVLDTDQYDLVRYNADIFREIVNG